MRPCFKYLTNINSFNLHSDPVKAAHVSGRKCDLPSVLFLMERAGRRETVWCVYNIKERGRYISSSLNKIRGKMIYRENVGFNGKIFTKTIF